MEKDITQEIGEMLEKIGEVQEPGWNGDCDIKECYWNMWNPNSKHYYGDDSKVCVSESLIDLKMTPNSMKCKGFWSYEVACGKKKGE